jgi:uncharacterized membrane protein (DUF2068 family)
VKRSGWVIGAVVAHLLCGALILGVCILLLILTRHPEVKYGKDAAEVVYGLKIAFALLAPIAVIVFAGAWGLGKNKLWGWWLALLTDAGMFGVFLYGMIDDGLHNVDWDMFAITTVALILTLWLLLPTVRRLYWNAAQPDTLSKLNEAISAK